MAKPVRPMTKTLMRGVNILALGFLGLHGYHALMAARSGDTYEDQVRVIDNRLLYLVLNPARPDALGFTIPFPPIAYVSRNAAEKVGVEVGDVVRHEAKHLKQSHDLGLLGYYKLEAWQREGVAEYARGNPTLDLCSPDPRATDGQSAYRQYFVSVKFLIEEKGLSEIEVYEHASEPVVEAEAWLTRTHCNQSSGKSN